MGFPAARRSDTHVCPAHGPSGLAGAGRADVRINSHQALHSCGDFCCGGGPCRSSGAATVRVNGGFAARTGDRTAHAGVLIGGSGNVRIGGPSGAGSPALGTNACEALGASRSQQFGRTHEGRSMQSYNNCVWECARYIYLRTAGTLIAEDDFLGLALAMNLATPGQPQFDPNGHGGGAGVGATALLANLAVPVTRIPQEPTAWDAALSENRAVMVFIDAKRWYSRHRDGSHAITLTGVIRDANGQPTDFLYVDSGSGNCAGQVKAEFLRSVAYPVGPMTDGSIVSPPLRF